MTLTMLIRSVILFLFSLVIIISFSQNDEKNPSTYLKEYRAFDKIYQEAEKLSLLPGYNNKTEELEEQMNQQALDGFRKIIPAIEKAGNDSLAFHCYYKVGVLEHYFENLIAAQKSYFSAIRLKERLPALADSFLFKTYLYTGSTYYSLNQFDSALSNYKKAEQVTLLYKRPLNESQRLYNTLGVMYYETGNYSQAKNYFEKALSVLTSAVPSYRDLSVNYKNNLASVFFKLENYPQADSIYKSLLQFNINHDEIIHNIGSIKLNLGAFKKALDYFRQLNYNNVKNVKLFNDFGLAFSGLKKNDSAEIYFRRALAENTKWNGSQKNISHGLTLKYLGDLSAEQKDYLKSAELYQQAIIQFKPGFLSSNIFSNPENYSGIFSYINLFNTLVSKAEILEAVYQKENDPEYLKGSLNAYRSAFELTDYVEQTYDSDEARLFLNKIKYTIHNNPINISLTLYEITGDNKYLEQAYFFDQQNKASILSLNVKENEIRKTTGSLSELFTQESSLKSSITRLSLKAAQLSDSIQLSQINSSIRDNEIRLGKLYEKMSELPEFIQKRSANRIPGIKEIRNKLDNTSAILSYHLSANELLIILISKEKFDYTKIPIDETFYLKIDSLKKLLHYLNPDQRFTGNATAGWLYQKLITPLLENLPHINRLVIIPDDELHYLPFEALVNEKNDYLLNRFSVQYQYSTSLLFNETNSIKALGTLGFAPFTSKDFTYGSNTRFDKLPYSKEEIADIKGKIFTDSMATKSNFILTANQFANIYLATHASINNEDPLKSFIAFYPTAAKNTSDFILYASEIYNMNLDSTDLIILSACETGSGKLIRGEGLMSLSRAFSYAGCSNIITSLWKAEDQATSFLAKRLHYYLNKKLRIDKALQLAKIDLLNSNNLDPRLKSPAHWSHFIFIGKYIPEKSKAAWWWFAAVIIFAGTLVWAFQKKKSFIN